MKRPSSKTVFRHGDACAHGGRLIEAARQFGIPLPEWLDLSTGINPLGWTVPELPADVWQRLPEDDDALESAARRYYGTGDVLPVAGSQAAIQALPRLWERSRVTLLAPGYAEHAAAWRALGHEVRGVTAADIARSAEETDVLVLINPNNPTGERFAPEQLLAWHQQLHARGGWLLVDEAFIDVTPEFSLASTSPVPGLIVLRSLGKFFGLAGARVGFVLAEPDLLAQLRQLLGPWSVSAPARWVATAALNDQVWQQQARQRLAADGERLHELLKRHGLVVTGRCAHFAWVRTAQATTLWQELGQQGILTRLFREPPSLRFGLPGQEDHWLRLDRTLAAGSV